MKPKAIDKSHTIKAVIFDFDCTVADTLDMMVEAKVEALEALGIDAPDKEYLKSLTVMLIRDSIAMVPGIRSTAIVDEVTALYHKKLMKLSERGCPLFPDVIKTFRELKKLGIKIGIVSLRPQAYLTQVLKTMKIDILVDAWVGENTVANGKPAADMVEYLLDKFDIPAENALMVGDTLYDLEMGHNAGTLIGACVLGAQPENVLTGINPDMIFNRYDSFIELARLAV